MRQQQSGWMAILLEVSYIHNQPCMLSNSFTMKSVDEKTLTNMIITMLGSTPGLTNTGIPCKEDS